MFESALNFPPYELTNSVSNRSYSYHTIDPASYLEPTERA